MDVLYSYYAVPSNILDIYEYQLRTNDINAIHFLYGRPQNITSTTTTTMTSITTNAITTMPTTTSTTAKITRKTYICKYRRDKNECNY